MTDYYVDSNAVGLNDGTSWANAAESIKYMADTIGGLVDGDRILVASDHLHNYPSTFTLSLTGVASNSKLLIISVNKTTGAYEAGATEGFAAGVFDTQFQVANGKGNVTIMRGITFNLSRDLYFQNGNCSGWVLKMIDCSISFDRSDSNVVMQAECEWHMKDCEYLYPAAFGGIAHQIALQQGARVVLDNITATDGFLFPNTGLVSQNSGGGNTLEIYNTDLTQFMGATSSIVANYTAGNDVSYVKVRNCKWPAGATPYGGSATPVACHFDLAGLDTGDNYAYFYEEDTSLGIAEYDGAQYLSDTYDGTTNFSTQIDTGSTADISAPFIRKLGTIPAQDLTTAKTVSVELAGSAGLLTTDVWLKCVIQDTTDQALGVTISGEPADPEATGSALTTSTAAWSVTPAAKYTVSLNLGAQAGITNSNVEVYLCVGKPNVAALNAAMPTIENT